MKYGELTLEQIEALVNKLGGMYGVQRVLSGEVVVNVATPTDFKVRRTIKLGTGLKTAEDFRKALKDKRYNISDCGTDILGKPAFTASDTEMDADLIITSVGDLGFKKGATRADIDERAQFLGLSPCPAEVGPQLCLQCMDQPKNDFVVISMEAIADSAGSFYLFSVEHRENGEQWLSTFLHRADRVWSAGYRFVYLRRK